jgi:magnesium and cobalt transporter
MSDADQPKKLGVLWAKLRNRLGKRNGLEPTLRQTLEDVIEEHAPAGAAPTQDDLGDVERTMLRNLLDYGDLRVDDVAVPRADVIAFDVDGSFDDLVQAFAEAGHSRMPAYRDSLDGVIGMVHVKDVYQLLAKPKAGPAPKVDHLLRSVLFVPGSMRVLDLLARMRTQRTHMAIVVDEFGGTDGLITIEDLVEQIVGDIEDEHDDATSSKVRAVGAGQWEADARIDITDLEKELGCDLLPEEEDEEIDTLGGLIFVLAGRVPAIGEVIEHMGYRFEIVDGEARRVTKVRISPPAPPLDLGS